MEVTDNLQFASIFVILSIGWFASVISDFKKPLKTKCLYGLLLATAVFIVFSWLTKDIAWPLYLMMIAMMLFLVSIKHFVDYHGDTYGRIDVLAFLKKKKTAVNNNRDDEPSS